jgi:hypothetical protein
MHTFKVQLGVSFDRSTYSFDSTSLTFDNNDEGVYFQFFPYKSVGTSVTANFFNERTRESFTRTLSLADGTNNTKRIFVSLSDFVAKDTYRFELYNGSTLVYRGKLFAYLGETQNYSIYNNEGYQFPI